jgi:hypothetical protein
MMHALAPRARTLKAEANNIRQESTSHDEDQTLKCMVMLYESKPLPPFQTIGLEEVQKCSLRLGQLTISLILLQG